MQVPERASHARLVDAAVVVLAIVVPYWRLALGLGIIVPDDFGISDFYDAEFASRVGLGRALRHGDALSWSRDVFGGVPTGLPSPLDALLFGALPPVAAVNTLLLLALCVAGLGALGLGRRLEMSRGGSLLTALSFAWSGYMVCQLRHLGIALTVCWTPLALLLLDRALSPSASARAARTSALLLACVVGMQAAAAFPQSLYIVGWLYLSFGMFRASALPRREALSRLAWLAGAALASILLAMGPNLPLWELGRYSVRREGIGSEWATQIHYNPRAAITFLSPYAVGDASDNTYRGGLFWEDFGYIGLAPFVLALWAVSRGLRRGEIRFWLGVSIVSYLLVLGPATPVFPWAFEHLPGLKFFRFPTRFLVLTDLALCVLAGFGLTHLERALTARIRPERLRFLAPVVLALTTLNLWWTQPRQNPIADARDWMSPPATARRILQEPGLFRVFTVDPYGAHMAAFRAARGWQNLAPLHANRDLLSPDANILWGITAASGYAGLSSQWVVALWGSHQHLGLIGRAQPNGAVTPASLRILAMNNVRFVLSRAALDAPELLERVAVPESPAVFVYRLRNTLPRAWVASRAVFTTSVPEAESALLADDFDPQRVVVVHARGASEAPPPDAPASTATLRRYGNDEAQIETDGLAPGWLVLSDSYYPGWEATLDGRPATVFRANINQRAVRLPPGRHTVRFEFTAPAQALGKGLSAVGLCLLALLTILARRAPDASQPRASTK